ncbi:MAG: hypothetical protein WC471_01320 [Candidatus Woesearchaeota archaeon]
MKKGQVFSMDLMFAVIVFIGVLFIVMNVWESTLKGNDLADERKSLELSARNIISQLMMDEGNPSDWTISSNMQSLGLAASLSINNQNSSLKSRPMGLMNRGYGSLSSTKISALQSMNYSYAKELLGVFSYDENFYIVVSRWNGTAYAQVNIIGTSPYLNVTSVVNIGRMALLNNDWAKLSLRVWKLCEGATCA